MRKTVDNAESGAQGWEKGGVTKEGCERKGVGGKGDGGLGEWENGRMGGSRGRKKDEEDKEPGGEAHYSDLRL